MYGKLFEQMYDGSLYGNWKALVTFQQMIVLCDSDGVIDMTPHALAARTGIPLDIITEGIAALEQPDQIARYAEERQGYVERHGTGFRFRAFNRYFRAGRLPWNEWREVRWRVLSRDGWRCRYCGQRARFMEVDHVRAVSRGGTNHDDNLAAACRSCNRSKRASDVSNWVARRLGACR